jgi:hypothetical protein
MFMLFVICFSLISRFEMKHSKQLEESRAVSQAAVKELEQLQVAILLTVPSNIRPPCFNA